MRFLFPPLCQRGILPVRWQTDRPLARALLLSTLLIACCVAGRPAAAADTDPSPQQVASLLVRKCLECHGGDATEGGYDVSSFAGVHRAGDSQATPIVAGKPAESELLRRLETDDESERMPSGGPPLTADEIAAVRSWIAGGAKSAAWPADAPLLEIAAAARAGGVAPEHYRRPLPVAALAILPQPLRIVTGGYGELLVWDADGKLVARWNGLAAATDTDAALATDAGAVLGVHIAALAVDAAASHLAIAHGTPGESGRVSIGRLDRDRLVELKTLSTLADVPVALAFDPQHRSLAIGALDGSLHIVDMVQGQQASSVPHADAILGVAWSDDGQQLMTASRDRTARVLQIEDGQSIGNFASHERSVHGVGYTPSGVLTIDETGTLRLWQLTSTRPLLERGDARQAMLGLRCHDGRILVPLAQRVMRTAVQSVQVPSADDAESGQDGKEPRKTKTVLKWQDWPALQIDAADWITSIAVAADASVAVGTHGGRVHLWRDGAVERQPRAATVFQATP